MTQSEGMTRTIAASRYSNFQECLEDQVRTRLITSRTATKYLKPNKVPLSLFLDDCRKQYNDYVSTNMTIESERMKSLIERAEEKGMIDGSLDMTYDGASRLYGKVRQIVEERGGRSKLEIVDSLDPITDSDLIATWMFCLPEVREKVGNKIENLYRVVLNVGHGKRKGYALPMRTKYEVGTGQILPPILERLISEIPKAETSEDLEYQRILRVVLDKKVEREVFPLFQEDQTAAFALFDFHIGSQENQNLKEAYTRLRETYRRYSNLELLSVNTDFKDPETGETGVLPSLHQRIAIYHLLHEKRLGVFDGCGTGKTAIATLTQPIIETTIREQGEEFRRAIVVCPNGAKKAWKSGLVGNDGERYFDKRQNIAVINGEIKSKEFIDSLKDKKWIVLNYEQLYTEVNGSGRLFVEELVDMGVDYVIFDECHHIKSLKTATKKGRMTQSASARLLGLSTKHLALLSGSPIPDSMDDYAVLYHLLNPESCKDPAKFEEMYKSNPRILYTLFNEKTVRRTSEDINHALDWEEIDDLVELDDVQRRLYNHIVEFRPANWLTQARKALLDPRLVNPEVLQRAGLLGQVSARNSAKYRKLEEILTADDGPVAKGEKFVIFSSMFREGVIESDNKGLRRRYEELGLTGQYEKLGLNQSLDSIVEEALEKRFGRKYHVGVIHGNVKEIEEREGTVERLKTDLDGIVCTTDTGGESSNYTAASYAIFLDDDYCPKTREQAIARLIRKGQKKKVTVRFLRGENTLDEPLRDYVEKKAIIAKIAMDGYPLTEEEKELLEDTQGRRLGELVKRSVGGVSINVLEAKVDNLSDFETKRRYSGKSREVIFSPVSYDTTDAQRVMQEIGKNPLGCWMNPEFVELYIKALPNLSVPVIHTAKIIDLLRRAKEGEIEFPAKVLSEGSGPSLLYNAYQSLSPLILTNGLAIPIIFDRDFSQLMLDRGANPNKIFGNMNGENSTIEQSSFDMVDNESITLLATPTEVKKCLREANRVLRSNGLLELVTKNRRFDDGFYSGLEELGFELVTRKDEGFGVSKSMHKRLKAIHGEHFADSYANKLASTYMILARKTKNPGNPASKLFLFGGKRPGDSEDEINTNNGNGESIRDPSESRSFINVRGRRKGARPSKNGSRKETEEVVSPEREITVDRNGIVTSVKKINGKNGNIRYSGNIQRK